MAENELSEELQEINKELENNDILKKKDKESAKNRRKYLNRKRRKAAAEKMAKLAAKQTVQEPIVENTEELPDEDWSGLNAVPLPIELVDDDEPLIEEDVDRYIPPKRPMFEAKPSKLRAEDVGYEAYKSPEPEVVLKPLPKIGTSISNPLNLRGKNIDITTIIEQLYGDIGYFILSEQMIPVNGDLIKLVQIKIDDGRCTNMFARI